MSKVVKVISPRGLAQWPKLFRPDTKFSEEGVYKTGLIVSPAEAKELQGKIKEVFTEEFGESKLAKASLPFKEDEDGNIVFQFKSKNKPLIVDSKGAPVSTEINVGGGSTIKVNAGIKAWSTGGKLGVTMYLNAVQIIGLVEFSTTGFQEEEGNFVAEEDQKETASVSEEEDGINF